MTENDLLYNKQFGFQKGHSTNHVIIQLADQIHGTLKKNIYTLGVFIEASKKLSHYGIKSKNLDWFTCYLSNRKQFIGYNISS